MLKYLLLFIAHSMAASSVPSKDERILQLVAASEKMVSIAYKPQYDFKFKNKAHMQHYVYTLSKKYNVNYRLALKIIKIESNDCLYKENTKSHDYGCMQINSRTLKAYKFNKKMILKNDAVGILAGIIVLRDIQKIYALREPFAWSCRFNIGGQDLPKTCLNYLNKMELASLSINFNAYKNY